jgi:T4-like virus tail tube protein gp19
MEDVNEVEAASTPSRRDVLKLGGLAAASGVTLGALGGAATAAAAGSASGSFQRQNHFSVEINGAKVHGVHTIDGLESDSDAEAAPPVTKGAFTMAKDWSNTPEWIDWHQSAAKGKVDRRSISVIFHNDAGEEAGRLNFYNCWPTKWSGPSLNARNSGHAVEKLTVNFEEWKFS